MGNDKMMKKQSKLRQYIGAPKRFLSKARDFYVDSMVSLDGKLANNNMMLPISPQISQTLPENLGSNNKTATNDNLVALCRSSTTRRRSSKHGDNNNKPSSNGKKVRFEGMNKSYSSVGLGRIDTIDEDKPYECDEDHSIMFARSRSHAVTRRNAA
ncbi:PREDICTED: uncharacterized protein LOC109184101 [Ipomoea nil]|uniref:uncharacterized protein LOC109184101 n=1 Tax=Ipomoea nil TaxID=35883 RepID=UPI000901C2C9|nr:PREDICTED: uncharacterized protein LOC109184101 [Ipomoea nil]